ASNEGPSPRRGWRDVGGYHKAPPPGSAVPGASRDAARQLAAPEARCQALRFGGSEEREPAPATRNPRRRLRKRPVDPVNAPSPGSPEFLRRLQTVYRVSRPFTESADCLRSLRAVSQ